MYIRKGWKYKKMKKIISKRSLACVCVAALSASLLVGCGGKSDNNQGTTKKYIVDEEESGAELTDESNAGMLCTNIHNAITSYDSTNDTPLLSEISTSMTINWADTDAGTRATTVPSNTQFEGLINNEVTSSTKSKMTGKDASATITWQGQGSYKITVTVGNKTVSK